MGSEGQKTYKTWIYIWSGSHQKELINLQTHVQGNQFFTQNIGMFDWLDTSTYVCHTYSMILQPLRDSNVVDHMVKGSSETHLVQDWKFQLFCQLYMELAWLTLKENCMKDAINVNAKHLYQEDNGSWFRGNSAIYVEKKKRYNAKKESVHLGQNGLFVTWSSEDDGSQATVDSWCQFSLDEPSLNFAESFLAPSDTWHQRLQHFWLLTVNAKLCFQSLVQIKIQ